MPSDTKAKVKVRAQVSYVHLVATSINMVNVKLKVNSVRRVAKYVILLKYVDPSLSTIAITGQITSLLDF